MQICGHRKGDALPFLIMPTSRFRLASKPAALGDGTEPITHEFMLDLGSGAHGESERGESECNGHGKV